LKSGWKKRERDEWSSELSPAFGRLGAIALGQQVDMWFRAFSPHPNRLQRLQIPAGRYLPLLEDKEMKVKIFSVRFYGDWKPIIVDELYRKLEEEKGRREFFAVNI